MAILDLHSHFSFKPANSKSRNGALPDADHWRERFKEKTDWSRFIAWADKDVVKSSQLNGDSATAGGFRVVVNGLYPLEQGFTNPMLNRELATLVGFDNREIEAIMNREVSYFDHLQREYRNLLAGEARNGFSSAGNKFKVVNSYAELLATHLAEPNTLCILNAVEGAHAFADNLLDTAGNAMRVLDAEDRHLHGVGNGPRRKDFMRYIDALRVNIDTVKSTWAHTPFFVTLAHHYYNTLCGMSPSLLFPVTLACNQRGKAYQEDGVNKTRYFDIGLRPWGRDVIEDLLRRQDAAGDPARRILIDTKHMSPQARLDYYTLLFGKRLQGDKIPIVASHTAVSGRRDLKLTIQGNTSPTKDFDLLGDEAERSKYFFNGVINLFDDEIGQIVLSDGIMGMMIDERRIMGRELPPEAGITMRQFSATSRANRQEMGRWTELRQQHAWGDLNDADFARETAAVEAAMQPHLDRLRPAYLSVLFRQLFHITTLVGERGWDHVALGTDYDGVINPIDVYKQSSDMHTLEQDMIGFWTAQLSNPDATVSALYEQNRFGQPPAHWISKFLWGNGMEFLRKYYNDEYLLHGRMVV